jgi:hypothetical protein
VVESCRDGEERKIENRVEVEAAFARERGRRKPGIYFFIAYTSYYGANGGAR